MTVRVRHRYGNAGGVSYRLGGGPKRKQARPAAKAPLPRWKRCNPAHDYRAGRGEFRDGPVSMRQLANGEQPRGHVCLPDCGCLTGFDQVFSDEYLLARECEKARDKRIAAHEASRDNVCGGCFTLLPVTGQCTECG